jgi:hypothetical protein
VYPDRAPSPGRTGPAGREQSKGGGKPALDNPTAYRPPIARGGRSGSVAAMMRAEREVATVAPGKVCILYYTILYYTILYYTLYIVLYGHASVMMVQCVWSDMTS